MVLRGEAASGNETGRRARKAADGAPEADAFPNQGRTVSRHAKTKRASPLACSAAPSGG